MDPLIALRLLVWVCAIEDVKICVQKFIHEFAILLKVALQNINHLKCMEDGWTDSMEIIVFGIEVDMFF
jgi:hypothetical protein